MGSDRLREDEWLVRDGAAKVLFCALAWTLAQWAGSGRIKLRMAGVDRLEGPFDDSLDTPLVNALERLCKLLKSTVNEKSRGFGGYSGEKDLDSSGIRALVKADYLAKIPLKRGDAPLLPAFSWLISSVATADAVPHENLIRLFKSVLVGQTFADVSEVPPNAIEAAERFSRFGPAERARAIAKGLEEGLGALHAPVARMLMGSEGSIERTTLAAYEAGVSLDRVQAVDPASEDQASPLPLRLLVRLAQIFGFSPVAGGAADIAAIEAALGRMPARRRAVWDAFCGPVDGKEPLRGGSGADFVECFERALIDGQLNCGGLPRVLVQKQPKDKVEAKPDPAAPPGTMPRAPAIAAQNDGIIINALSTDPDDISMTVGLRREDGRIVLSSIRYRLDQDDADGDADLRLCLRRIVTRWNWRESMLVELEDDCEAALRQSVVDANPGLIVNNIETDTAVLCFSVGPADRGGALPPRPDVAVERLVLPPASLRPDDTVTHKFELYAYWKDVAVLQRRNGSGFEMLDRGALKHLLDEKESGARLLMEFYAQIEHRFPIDGQRHLLGVRQAKVQRVGRPAPASVTT